MEYVVSVRRTGATSADLPADMADMRSWLDHKGIEASSFCHSSSGPGIAFRVGFSAEDDAAAFAAAFDGWMEGRDRQGATLWEIHGGHNRL